MTEKTPLQRAREKYSATKRVAKTVVFNREKDAELLAFAQSLPDFSGWVKAQLAEEMQARKKKK